MTQTLQAVHTLIEMLTPDLDEYGNVPRMLARIVKAAEQLFEPDICAITAINPETGHFLLPLSSAATADNIQHSARPQHQGLTQYVLDHGALFVPNLAAQPQFANSVTAAHSIRSFVAVALRTRPYETGLAVLYLNYRQPQTFNRHIQELLDMFVDHASTALQQTWLIFRYAEVARIGQEINRQLESVETIFLKLATNMADIFDASYAVTLAVYQPATETLDFHILEGDQYRLLEGEPFEGGSRWVIDEQRPLLIRRLSVEEPGLPVQLRHLPNSEAREESLLFVPLIVGQTCLGVLSIQHPEPTFFDDEDLQVLRLLGNHTALALYNLGLVNDLRQLNEAGQRLTEQLDSQQVLQDVVEQIRSVTKADLAILYPYVASTQRFELPPKVSGTLQVRDYPRDDPPRPDDIALLTVQHTTPAYAEETTRLFAMLGGEQGKRQGSFAQREGVRSTVAVPLRVSDEPIGALFVNFRHTQRFDASQKQLIEGLANYAAIAIANARAFGTLVQRRVDELNVLQRIDRTLSQTLDLQPTLQTILELATKYIPTYKASIFLYDAHTQALRTSAFISRVDPGYFQDLVLPINERRGLVWWAFEHRRPIRVANVQTDSEWRDLYVEVIGETLAEMDVPLVDGEEIMGVINFESTTEGMFSQADEEWLATLAGQAVLAIKNAQAYEREKRLADERQAIIDISREIISQLEPMRVFELILTRALGVTRCSVGTLHIYDADHHDLRLVAERGVLADQKSRRLEVGQGIVGMVAAERSLLNVPDVLAPPWDTIHVPDIPNIRSELAVPLIEGDILRGVLNVEHHNPGHFNQRDERLLLALADQVVIAMQNAERYQQAEAGRQRLDALHLIDQQMLGQLVDPEQVIRTILESAMRLTKGDVAHLVLYEAQTPQITYAARRDSTAGDLTIDSKHHAETEPEFWQGIIQHVGETRMPYRTGAAQGDIYYRGSNDIQSEMAVPLLAEMTLFGVLNLESRRPGAFSADDQKMLELLANQAVIAIQSARQYALVAQAQQRMREIETMSAIGQAAFELAHRLGNDLGPIIPAVNAIRRELEQKALDDQIIMTNLNRIVEDKNRVTELIKALKKELATLKEETGAAQAAEPVLVRDLLEETARSYSSLPPNIRVQIEAKDPAAVHAVYHQISAILRNLFANAVEALPDGGTVMLTAQSAGQFVKIQVADTGPGIPEGWQARIFDLFVSTKGSFGFGLWSARRNALANGGDLRVESRQGDGATFTLTLRGATMP